MKSYTQKHQLRDMPYAKKLVLICIFPLSLILKIAQYTVLPPKFFYDSNHIKNIMQTGNLTFIESDSYNNSALLFNAINFLNLNTLVEWSIAIAFIADIYLFFFLINKKIESIKDTIIVFCFLGLLNIYVFNLSKDIIQFSIFALIGLLIQSKKIKLSTKIILISLVFIAESILYRSYYILTAAFLIIIAVCFPKLEKWFISNTGVFKKILLILLSLFAFLFVFLKISQYVKPEEYQELMEVRNKLTAGRVGDADSNTVIVNLIQDNGNHFLYLINYFINGFRILFPIELLPKGLYYYPFFIFQIICSIGIIKCLLKYKDLDKNMKLTLYVTLAYIIVAILFEPDFGSFVRHEAATFSILFMLLTYNSRTERNKNDT